MNNDPATERMMEQRQLKLFRPMCYGLAAAGFSLTIQTLFSTSCFNWAFYLLMALVIPLLILGTLSSILCENSKPRPKSSSILTILCYSFIVVTGFALGACLESFKPMLGWALGGGLAMALCLMKILEHFIILDKKENP